MNDLHWSYCALTGYDEDRKAAMFTEGLLITESYDTYELEVNFLLSVETRRFRESNRILFADCFLEEGFLSRVGLSSDTCYVI
jgi:hypothetical protein